MKAPFNIRAPSFDAQAINEIIHNALASAGLDATAGPMRGVTETIRRALSSGGIPTPTRGMTPSENVVDIVARVADVPKVEDVGTARRPLQDGPKAPAGTFDAFECANRAGVRTYKLYVPTRVGLSPPPLVVMLHVCTQSADDFAAGTRMNRLADEHGFLVVYPEQAISANPSKCWSWFKAQDQGRESGAAHVKVVVASFTQPSAEYGESLQPC